MAEKGMIVGIEPQDDSSPIADKELCARFDGGRLPSGGGALVFAGIERRLGIAELPASRVTDERDPGRPPDLNRHTPRLLEACGFVNAESPSLISRGIFPSNFVPTIVTDHREVMPTKLARGSAQESLMM